MPPTKSNEPFAMPTPPAIVAWRQAPDATPNYAIVTEVGRQAITIMVFPTESRVGIPKTSVRHCDDPWNQVHGYNPDAGTWDFTDESKRLEGLAQTVAAMNSSYMGGSPKK